MIHIVQTPALDLAYEAQGPEDGEAVILLHGFPGHPHSFDAVANTPQEAPAETVRAILHLLRP